MSKKKATITVEAYFNGNYYSLDELVPNLEDWIQLGCCDRDDLVGLDISGYAYEENWDD